MPEARERGQPSRFGVAWGTGTHVGGLSPLVGMHKILGRILRGWSADGPGDRDPYL
jgi:hypothetical protein